MVKRRIVERRRSMARVALLCLGLLAGCHEVPPRRPDSAALAPLPDGWPAEAIYDADPLHPAVDGFADAQAVLGDPIGVEPDAGVAHIGVDAVGVDLDEHRHPIAARPLAVGGLLATLVALLYGPFLHSPFFFDDYHSLVDNRHLRDVGNIPRFFLEGTGYSAHAWRVAYRPLLSASFALSFAVTGEDPWSFRIVNVFLLAANGWIVFLLLRRLFAGTGTLVSR